MTSCCPAGAWGELKNSSYTPRGVVDQVDDLKIYRIGKSPKCIIWNYDMFGFDGGMTKQMADFLADQGYMVLLPDFYRGNMKTTFEEGVLEFVQDETKWEEVLKIDWEKKIHPYALKHGAKTFGCIGTCWGTYMVLRLSSYTEFKAGICMHSSHPLILEMLGEDEAEILKDVKCPQMFMSAGDDDANVKEGGLGRKILGDGVEIIEFPDMEHGWTIRGDLSIPEVERDVKKAFNVAVTFFGKYLH